MTRKEEAAAFLNSVPHELKVTDPELTPWERGVLRGFRGHKCLPYNQEQVAGYQLGRQLRGE